MTDLVSTPLDTVVPAQPQGRELKWFIIHTYSGYEAKVMEHLRQRIQMEERQDSFGDIQIPEETYEEMKVDAKSGKKERVVKKRKSFPGYLLVQIAVHAKGNSLEMEDADWHLLVQIQVERKPDGSVEMADADWHLVRNTPKVTSFVGANKKRPTPLTDEEVRQIMHHTEETQEKPKPKYHFEKGEKVRIIDGPFANFEGDVEEIHEERSTIKVMVTVFGRSTPVELDFIQVEKR
jgi:transcriptional antiterminator NusG